jgi:hypothetical protein
LPALAAAQSVTASHPHFNVLGSHFDPFTLPTQLMHAPDPPQALLAVPATQDPFEQQPPLHVAPVPHDVEHTCVVVLQAWPEGQSAGLLQPH